MKNLVLVSIISIVSLLANANLVELKSPLWTGKLYINDHATGSACYLQINRVVAAPEKGKHCQRLVTQWMFNLDSVQDRGDEILVTSRKTNNEADFHKPTTCAEVVAGVPQPWTVNKWGDDDKLLYNELFNAELPAVNGGTNHYTVIFSGTDKAPTRAMIYNVTLTTENSYECVGLK